ncbi:C40 family peptidase [Bifidobacterium xylocopae]|uniref:Peptidase P60 n=1 Tax=Bifidobacterium xylocopae TaxID=2493119 RepID=A0A366KDL8_9BIFI|nr:C40 family peptidase [Bifidobacterium xylocopae]RBP99794.1 peptidase P60 [Bifidobacterium xylocopae]
MSIQRKTWTIAATSVLAGSTLFAGIPAVAYASSSNDAAVTSSRSFKPTDRVRRNLLAESTSTSVDKNSNWGGVESLNVPLTRSQAEKDQEAAAAAKAKAEANAAQAQREAAASRSASRPAVRSESFTATPPDGATADALVRFATQFAGRVPYVGGGKTPAGWDCSGMVQYVFAQFGISAPAPSGTQATLGRAVPSLAQAMPGDIIANQEHVAIYIGGGMVVNALNPSQGTQVTPVSVSFGSPYSIRRLL